jgi:hypothetical protein
LKELSEVAIVALEFGLVAATGGIRARFAHLRLLPVGSVLTTITHELAAFVTFRASGNGRRLQTISRWLRGETEAGPTERAGFAISGAVQPGVCLGAQTCAGGPEAGSQKEAGPLGTGRLRASGEEVLL